MIPYDAYRDALKGHVITKIEYFGPRARYPRILGKNAIRGYHGFGGTVQVARLTTDRGATGWGSLCRPANVARAAENLLLGQALPSVFDPEIGMLADGLLPFDIALHDLAGRIIGIPVCRMMNDAPAKNVRVYDAAIYMNDIIPEDRPFGFDSVIQDCLDDYAAGHRTMKIKIGRSHMWMAHDEGLQRDIDIVKAVHDRLPDVLLMVDANDGYSVDDCIAFLKGIGSVPLYWFEEPFRESVADNGKLLDFMRVHCPATYLADGESNTDIPLLFELAEKRLLDIWMPDVCDYGFTAWRKLIQQMVAKGYLGSPHAWGQALKTHYCAHLAVAYPHNMPYVEGVPGLTEGVDYMGYQLANGVIDVPDRPGFGMELLWAPEL